MNAITLTLLMLVMWGPPEPERDLSRNSYCQMIAGNAVGLSQLAAGRSDRLRLDLALTAIRVCPVDFVASASLFSESEEPFRMLANTQHGDSLSEKLAGDAANELVKHGQKDAAVTRRLLGALGQPKAAGRSILRAVVRRDSGDLAEMAAKEVDRTGDSQTILVGGTLIMWLVDREALNAAFLANPRAQQWLRPYPPTVVEVGPVVGSEANDAFAVAVRKTAMRFSGPVDLWFRKFKIER